MSCNLTGGWQLTDICRDSEGGVRRVFIGAYFSGFDPVVSGTYSNIISGWGAGGTPSFYIFEQDDEVASFTIPGEFSTPNGTAFWRPAISITLLKLSDTSNGIATILGRGAWFVIVEDNNDNYWLLNRKKAMRVTEGSAQTGQAGGDLNGITITLAGASKDLPFRVDAALMIAPVIVQF